MYVKPNFKTKEALGEAVAAGSLVTVFIRGYTGRGIGEQSRIVAVEGPHYPKLFEWYAKVEIKRDRVIKVI